MRRDSSGFLVLGARIASTKGLTKYLAEVAPLRKHTRFGAYTLIRAGGCHPRSFEESLFVWRATIRGDISTSHLYIDDLPTFSRNNGLPICNLVIFAQTSFSGWVVFLGSCARGGAPIILAMVIRGNYFGFVDPSAAVAHRWFFDGGAPTLSYLLFFFAPIS